MTKILIVENRSANRSLRQLLESQHYQVVEASDAAQALTYARLEHPDLVLLESDLAEHSITETIAELLAHPATAALPLIVLDAREAAQVDLAYDTDNDVERLTRPISDSALLARIRSALRTSQVQAELQRRNEQLSALTQIMDAANSTLDLSELVERVIERALIVTPIVSAGIWLREHDTLVCLAQHPPAARDQRERQAIKPDTPLGRVVSTGQAEFAEVAARAGEPPGADQPAAILPLVVKDNLIGVFVFSVQTGRPIPLTERAVFSAIATHVAVAIHHAQLYQQAERQRQELQAIDQQKDEFISITSHELKNPMASIKGYADLMLRRSAKNPDDPNRKGLEIISQQVLRMTKLLDQLLDVSRIGMNRLQLERRLTDLAVVARRVVDELRATTEQHELRLELQSVPLIGVFDEARMSQAIGNLVSNAIKYSPNGGVITVRLANSVHGDRHEALLTVSDQGIGIPLADRDHLFERFFRASNADASFPGMGLGLFITRGLVARNGGRIWVESTEGHGTTFSISLPLEQS
jgi:signal transduction histidine kinase/DNA-binding response OmpR family regulator